VALGLRVGWRPGGRRARPEVVPRDELEAADQAEVLEERIRDHDAIRHRRLPEVMSSLSVSATVQERWRQTGYDAVYVQPYAPIAATLGNHERRVGEGYRVDAVWRANRYLTLSGELLHQTAGPAIRLAGGHAVDFAMLIGQLRF